MPYTLAPCANCKRLNRVDLERAKTKTPICGECKQTLSLRGPVVEVGGSALGQVVRKSDLPVVAEFWKPSAGGLGGTFSESATELAGRAVFVRVNVKENPTAQSLYELKALPTLVVFFGGKEKVRKPGVISPEAFRKWVREVIP
jgi:thioredoxin 2